MIALNYAQPFLIMRLIDYVGEKNPNKNEGYGIIGAFALVFVMKGVWLFYLRSSTKGLRFDISYIRSSTVVTSTSPSASLPRLGEH